MWEGYTPSPQAGAETRFPRMFTLDGHAHGAQRRNENSSWEGCALPNPPRWRVVSWEGVGGAAAPRPYAQTLPRAGYVHLRAKGSPYGLTVIAPRVIQGPAFPATSSAWTRTR